MQEPTTPFPLPLDQYIDPAGASVIEVLWSRIEQQPVNAIVTAIFLLAVLHTFVANRFLRAAHHARREHDEARRSQGLEPEPSFKAEMLHFLGEVEVVFGMWVLVLLAALSVAVGWSTARDYLASRVHFVEPMFVVVIMAIASTRPVVAFAQSVLQRVAALGGSTPSAWWLTILTLGPIFGSFITEPGAMTICAMLLGRQFYGLEPSRRLRYATLGLLFVNVSIGGTLTHFAAPPVLMVSAPWGWSLGYMATNFGWKAAAAIVTSNLIYFAAFRRELQALASAAAITTADDAGRTPPIPAWITAVNLAFLTFVVVEAHYPVLFIGAFLFFIGFAQATAAHQSSIDLKPPLLVGFFLAGLVTHGALQGWWIAPVLGQPHRAAALLERDIPHVLQRQRAHHLPGDARAKPDRESQVCGGGRRGDRRRAHGDCQCAQPRRPGDSRQVLSGRCVTAVAGHVGPAADAGRRRVVPARVAPL